MVQLEKNTTRPLFFQSAFHRLRNLIRTWRFPVWVVEGVSGQVGGELRLLYGGSEADKTYIAKRAFNGPTREICLGKRWVWKVSKLAREHQCDIDIAPTINGAWAFKKGGERFYIPCWLTGEVLVTAADLEEGSRSNSRRRDIRQINKHGFSYEVTQDPYDLDAFYHTMYLPTMMASHAEGALLMKYDHMMQRLQLGECELVMITQNGHKVAGSLITYEKQAPRLWSEGILDADRRYLRMGIGAAIYLFSFRHLLKEGYDRVNIGRSRAFLSDGALYFKKRLGLELTDISENGFMLQINALPKGACDFLIANPFVFHDGADLLAAVFVDAGTLVDKTGWTSLWKANYIRGISRIIIYAIGEQAIVDGLRVPDLYLNQMELRGIVDPIT